MVEIKEKVLYTELEFFIDNTKIGGAELREGEKFLSSFRVFDNYQDKGYGQQIFKRLIDKYDIRYLFVDKENTKAIHIYEKFGFKKKNCAIMYFMIRE